MKIRPWENFTENMDISNGTITVDFITEPYSIGGNDTLHFKGIGTSQNPYQPHRKGKGL